LFSSRKKKKKSSKPSEKFLLQEKTLRTGKKKIKDFGSYLQYPKVHDSYLRSIYDLWNVCNAVR